MQAKDIMTQPVHTVRADEPVARAVELLEREQITAVPVVDDQGTLVGSISALDMLRQRTAAGTHDADRPSRRVAEVMSGTPVSGWPVDEVADIARLMVEQRVHTIPIVTDDHLIGVVSRIDVLRTITPTDEAAGVEAQRRLDAYAGGERRWTVAVENGAALLSGNLDDAIERNVVAALVQTTTGIDTVRMCAEP